MLTGKRILNGELKICSRCIYDETIPAINFDSEGVCNYCKMIDGLQNEYKTATPDGEKKFLEIVEQIKKEGKGKKYDCAIGVSGGTDSSYIVYKAVKDWGLRPIAVHYDNTWNSAIATENIRKVLGKLNVDLFTYVVDNKESDDMFRSFFLAGVPELDGPTDMAAPEVMYRACAKYKIKYVIEGHSFRTEGVSPLGNMYIDGKYVQEVHKKYGKMKLKTFPNMPILTFLKWLIIYRIKKIRPLWYISYNKEEARDFLQKEFSWQYYGGHHLENRLTAFHHSYYNPNKFGLDQRNNSLSASIRSGLMTKEEAIKEYAQPPYLEPELLEYFKKRLNLSDEEFDKVMTDKPNSYKNFKTYKKTFERLRPLFYLLYKANMVPKSFYIKYTSKSEM
jgi:N-acetyl sugar amidotransferase